MVSQRREGAEVRAVGMLPSLGASIGPERWAEMFRLNSMRDRFPFSTTRQAEQWYWANREAFLAEHYKPGKAVPWIVRMFEPQLVHGKTGTGSARRPGMAASGEPDPGDPVAGPPPEGSP
jgi:hypothetical protein